MRGRFSAFSDEGWVYVDFVADTGKARVGVFRVNVSDPSEIPTEKANPSIYRTSIPGSVQEPTNRLFSGAEHTQQAKSM